MRTPTYRPVADLYMSKARYRASIGSRCADIARQHDGETESELTYSSSPIAHRNLLRDEQVTRVFAVSVTPHVPRADLRPLEQFLIGTYQR